MVACTGDPSWTLDTTAPETWTAETAGESAAEPGAVTVVEVEGEPWVVWVVPLQPPRARPLAGGEVVEVGNHAVAGISAADLDGDGATDLVLSGGFQEIRWSFGTADEVGDGVQISDGHFLRDTALLDIDGDGLLDLFSAYTSSDHTDADALRGGWRRNLGDREFADEAPLEVDDTFWGPAFDATALDYDADGDTDLYVCNDFGNEVVPNGVLRNDDGTLVVDADSGLDLRMSCMGTTFGGTRADGGLDVVLAAAEKAWLYESIEGVWVEEGAARGIPTLAPDQMSWGAAVTDLDSDGAPDLVIGTAGFYGRDMPTWPLWMLFQAEDGSFSDEGEALGFPREATTHGVVVADLYGDGVPEIVVGDAQRSPWIWDGGGCGGAWLGVEGPLNSLVTVEAGGKTWTTLITTESGWGGARPARAHVGLGEAETVDRVTILAPGGEVGVLQDVAARRVVRWAP